MSRALHASKRWLTGGRGQGILVFLGFFLIFNAWSFAAPYDAPPDEVQHGIRAVGVLSGQIAPEPIAVKWGKNNDGAGAIQRVPAGLWHPATCWGFTPQVSAACAEPVGGGPLVDAPTSAGRYNPAYYAAVGLPLKLWPGWGGLVLSRIISAALSAALLAWSFVLLSRWSRHGLMLAGLLASATPMLAHLAGAINPNGLEIAAGIAFFCGAIPLLLGDTSGRSRAGLIWLAGTGAVVLAPLRALGPVWLAFGLAALLIPQSRTRLRQLWSERLVRRWVYGIAASLAFAVGWILISKAGEIVQPTTQRFHFGMGQATLMYFGYWDSYLRGMVGVAGWFDIFMPSPFYWLWIVPAASLIVFALVVSGWGDRWRFLTLFAGGFIVPGVLQVSQANVTGFVIGGRYMLPLLVGMPLLAAFIVERRLLNAHQSHSMTKLFCLMLLPSHLVLLLYAMMRWQQGNVGAPGPGRLNPLAGDWHPPTGSIAPVVIMLVGLAVVARVFWVGPSLVTAARDAEALAAAPDADASTDRDEVRPTDSARRADDRRPADDKRSPAREVDGAERATADEVLPTNGERSLRDRARSNSLSQSRPAATSGRPGEH